MKKCLAILLLAFSGTALADISGKVVAVTDGDTLKVLDSSNTQYKVRLTGIDAPEKAQPFGNASRKYLASMVAGKKVRVESSKSDRYGRVLGKVWVQPRDCPSCGKTLDANHAQVLSGMAWWYRYYAKDQSPEDRGRYESAENEAKSRGLGLWSESGATPPWEWRKKGSRQQQVSNNTACKIKGNIGSNGSRIYHLPGTTWYSRTKINTAKGERWFCSEEEALAAGWRAPRK